MIALLDGDVLVYYCGFSSDSNARKDLKSKWEEEGYHYNENDERITKAHEPLAYALQHVKKKINELLETVGASDYRIYLTGKTNFRNDLLPEYKANRKDATRPYWYKEIKQYLIDTHNAVMYEGLEADDMLGIKQCQSKEDTIICTIDKDLDMIPGKHYNWSKNNYEKGVYEVDELEALHFFYTQCLTGDSVDNIPGLKKSIGKVASKKLKQGLLECDNELDMYLYVKEAYGDFDFHPIAKCLWIMREMNKQWQKPE